MGYKRNSATTFFIPQFSSIMNCRGYDARYLALIQVFLFFLMVSPSLTNAQTVCSAQLTLVWTSEEKKKDEKGETKSESKDHSELEGLISAQGPDEQGAKNELGKKI